MFFFIAPAPAKKGGSGRLRLHNTGLRDAPKEDSSLSSAAELGRREHFRIFASPTQKHIDDAKRKDAPPLKMMQSRKTRGVTDAKFCVTAVSDIS